MLFQCLYYLCYFNMKTAFGRFNQNERNALLTQAVYIITAHPLMLYWQLCKAVPLDERVWDQFLSWSMEVTLFAVLLCSNAQHT